MKIFGMIAKMSKTIIAAISFAKYILFCHVHTYAKYILREVYTILSRTLFCHAAHVHYFVTQHMYTILSRSTCKLFCHAAHEHYFVTQHT